MATATLSSKGRLVIPKEIRDCMCLHAGDRIDFYIRDNGEVAIRSANNDVRDLKGLLAKRKREPVSIGRMNQAPRDRSRYSK